MARFQVDCGVELSIEIASEHPAMDGDVAKAMAEGRITSAMEMLKELGVIKDFYFGEAFAVTQRQCKPLRINQ